MGDSGSIFHTIEKVDILQSKNESLSIKLTTLKKIKDFFWNSNSNYYSLECPLFPVQNFLEEIAFYL